MFPAYKSGEVVLVDCIVYKVFGLRVDNIIVLKHPYNNSYIIKRITKKNNNLYFVRGDNKNESTDSKNFGWISKKDIIGRVIMKI